METAIRWLYGLLHVEPTHPWLVLVALLAIPAYEMSRMSAGRVVFSSLRALPLGGRTWRTRLAWLPDALIAVAVVALAIALSGPRAGDRSARVRRDGIAIMMAVDVSGSMRALDLSERGRELTRLDAVKQTFERFVLGGGKLDGRPDDAIGLVAFASYAETRSPLTLDHGNLAAAARQVTFARDDESRTAIGAGLELAVQRLAEFKARSKVAILLTDGESNIHDIDEDTAIDDAVKAGVKVYTIGAGTTGVAPIRLQRPDGGSQLVGKLDRHRVGLVAFAGRAATLCPLTPDHAFFTTVLATVDTRSAGRGGSRVGEAIKTAVRGFPPGQGAKLMVLITDGDDQDPYSEDAAKLARDAGIKIVAIGL
ncbi:MAG TPA: VWA domain-containing protein, partial [Kofleriaceae bacterium]|nr:VWA domain-containing protein [Kofleriaceae bacterium]